MKTISVLGVVAAFCFAQTATALPRHSKITVLPVSSATPSGTPSISPSSTPSVAPSSSSIVPSSSASKAQPTSSVAPWPPVNTPSNTVKPRPTGIFPTGAIPTGTGNATPTPLHCVPTDGSEGGPPYGLPCGHEDDNRPRVPVGPKFNHRRPHHFKPLGS